eukprot:6215378-Karenia_brevis.AAC.1
MAMTMLLMLIVKMLMMMMMMTMTLGKSGWSNGDAIIEQDPMVYPRGHCLHLAQEAPIVLLQ